MPDMMRNDREIAERKLIDAVWEGAQYCHVAMIEKGTPYVLPMNFAYDGRNIFLHSAREGLKIAALRANPLLCVQAEHDVELVRKGPPCSWGMHYRSAIARGMARFLEDAEERHAALTLIARKYGWEQRTPFPEAMLARVCVICMDIEEMSGKQFPAQMSS